MSNVDTYLIRVSILSGNAKATLRGMRARVFLRRRERLLALPPRAVTRLRLAIELNCAL